MKRMSQLKRKVFLAVLLALLTIAEGSAQRLVDNATRSPLPMASITDCRGNVVGMTNQEGVIPSISADRFPVTFSYIGYRSLELRQPVTDDVGMTPLVYELSDVVVRPQDRPMLHVTAYVREVSSLFGSSDSVTVFAERIVDYMLPVGKTRFKGWVFPRKLATKAYTRMTNAEGRDSVCRGVEGDAMLWSNTAAVLFSSFYFPASMNNSDVVSAVDTVMGKYAPKFIWQKSGGVVRCFADALADSKEHVFSPKFFKLLGFTTDITDMTRNYVFHVGGGNLSLTDMTSMSISMDMRLRGKMYKKFANSSEPIIDKSYIEVYFTDYEYLSVEEAKKLKKERPVVSEADVIAPPGVPELHPGVRQIVERVEALEN